MLEIAENKIETEALEKIKTKLLDSI